MVILTAMDCHEYENASKLFMKKFGRTCCPIIKKKTYGVKPLLWLPFPDEVFVIWTSGEAQFKHIFECCEAFNLNETQPSTSVNFLVKRPMNSISNNRQKFSRTRRPETIYERNKKSD